MPADEKIESESNLRNEPPLVFNRALSQKEIDEVGSYLARLYGLDWTPTEEGE